MYERCRQRQLLIHCTRTRSHVELLDCQNTDAASMSQTTQLEGESKESLQVEGSALG